METREGATAIGRHTPCFMPYSLQAPVHSERIIKKSSFIGCVECVPDRATALSRAAALRAEHLGATHVCWALMAGGHSPANDDGSPVAPPVGRCWK